MATTELFKAPDHSWYCTFVCEHYKNHTCKPQHIMEAKLMDAPCHQFKPVVIEMEFNFKPGEEK